MVKLLIIADDFTGALDASVHFAVRGARTCVTADGDCDLAEAGREVQVLVLSTDTRHLPPKDAYRVVYDAVSRAKAAGYRYIFKKTDSALRGNVGSELAAVMDAAGADNLVFVPAFPQIGRVTRNGILYIEGVPVAESVFGRDPFEPVRCSRIRDIIAQQTDKAVILHTASEEVAPRRAGIQVYDAETQEDLVRVLRVATAEDLQLTAGCAGFASVLADYLDLKGVPEKMPELPSSLFVVCGSMNPVTIRQLDEAERAGIRRFRLTPQQKLDATWLDSEAGQRMLQSCLEQLRGSGACMVDVNSPDSQGVVYCSGEEGMSAQDARSRIAANMGLLIKRLLDMGMEATLLCTGGDTLQALTRAVGVTTLVPVCELAYGTVLTRLAYAGKDYYIITKSGGFGEPELITTLASRIGVKLDKH